MKKRVFCFLLAFCMMMSLMPGAVFAEEPATEEPAYEETTMGEPADEESAYEDSENEEPIVGEPADEEPAVEEPISEELADEEPANEEPADEDPVNEEPTAGELADEEPVDEEPVEAEPADEESLPEEPETEVLDFESEEEETFDAETIEEDSATEAVFETVIPEDEEEVSESEAVFSKTSEDDQELIDSEYRNTSAEQEAVNATVTSSIAKPTITKHPSSTTVNAGSKATFTVAVSGDNLSYQWQVYSSANGTWVNSGIASAKTATLSFTANSGNNGLKYRCAVTNSAGTVYSNAATLTVKVLPPVITSHPRSITVTRGSKATFTVTATGDSLSYQWQVYVNERWVNSGNYGADTATLSFTADMVSDGFSFRCAVTNSAGTVYSDAATLTVNWVPVITGTCGDNLTWTLDDEGVLTISGTGPMDNYDYKYDDGNFYWDPAPPWLDLKVRIKTAIIQTGVTSIGFWAFAYCSSLTSITIPNSVTRIGDNALNKCDSLTSIAIPDGVASIGGSAFYNCSGLTSVTIPNSVTSIGGGAFYGCSGLTSITIPSGLTSIESGTFYGCSGLRGIIIPDSVTSIDFAAFYDCSGLTRICFKGAPPSIGNYAFYRVTSDAYYPDNGSWGTEVRQNYGGTLTWKPYHAGSPAIVVDPISKTVMSGEKVTFTVTATGDSLNYQWQVYNASTGKWANSGISSAKTATLSFTANTGHNGLQYRCVVSNSAGTVYSDTATLTVSSSTAKPTITKHPASMTVNAGTKVTMTVTATGSGLSYQWQVRANSDASWISSSISSAKTAALTFTPSDSLNGYQYRCAVKNSAGTVYSNVAVLTVKSVATAKPVITRQPASASVNVGAKVTLVVTATGGGLSYQWQVRANSDANWSNSTISSAKTTTMVFTPSDSLNGYQYRCKVTNSYGTTYSNAATLTISSTATAKPTITRQPASASVNAGSKVTLTVTATGGGLSYQWQVRKNSSSSWSNSTISSAKTTTMVFTPSASLNGYQYRCAVKNSYGTTYSNAATLTVK